MTSGKYAALVLAAGLSSRMNEFKPLLKIGKETITDRVISIFRDNGVDVFLVTGWRSEELIQGISRRDIAIVSNPEYETGMFSSVRAGVAQLPHEINGFFIMPVDIPLVRAATIKQLLLVAASKTNGIIYPTFAGQHGHPTFVTSDLIGEILGWNKEGGLKAILDSHMELRFEIPVADTGILLDVDSPADYAALLERYRKYDNPAYSEINAMLDIAGTPNNVRRHCRKVAEIAVRICNALADSGFKIDVDIIRSAALLHDIARTTTNHDAAGSKILQESGFPRIADIVACHTDITKVTGATFEDKIVFLADKFVKDENLVTLEKRYAIASEKYGSKPEVAANILRGLESARSVKHQLEELIRKPLDTVIFRK